MATDARVGDVLEQVRRLTAEVQPRAAPATVTLDSRFEELGIGSLELAELLLRLQDAFKVALPAHLLASAQTPRDLVQAVTRTEARVAEPVGEAPPLGIGVAATAPIAAATLIEVLGWHVGATPDRTHIRILDDTGPPDELTYGALHREATSVAAALQAYEIIPGDTVAIMLPTSRAYFVTFTGVLLAGGVPVPIYPPARPSQLADHLRRHIGILTNARAVLLVTVSEAVTVGHLLRSNVASLRHVFVPESLTGAAGLTRPRPRSADLALVQYTSGSTGQPKGVALTHHNLLANIRAMGEATDVSGTDTFVSWLPLYHEHGVDRRVAGLPLFRHPAGRDGSAGLLDPSVAVALGNPRQPRHHLGRPELRLRAVPDQGPRCRVGRARLEFMAIGVQRCRTRKSGDDRTVRETLFCLRFSPERHHTGIRIG